MSEGNREKRMGVVKQKWPSLDVRWKSGWKVLYENRLRWFERFYPLNCQELEYFASTGNSLEQTTGIDLSQYKEWLARKVCRA